MAVASFIFFTILLMSCGGRYADTNDDQVTSSVNWIMNTFGIKFYKELIKSNSDNLFCSGFSISVLLNMLLAGARTETATEIRNTLGNDIGLTQSEIESWIHEMLTQQRGDHPAYELDIANGMWIHQDYHVLPEFKSKIVDTYYAEEAEVTFGTPEATSKINNWVSNATKGNIPKLFDETLDGLVRLVLVNAMYFNGSWETKFQRNLTEDYPFHYNNGESTKDVKMMRILKKFSYADSAALKSQLLEIPYEGGEVSMIVVLPHENNGLGDLEKDLDFFGLREAMRNMNEAKVNVKLPKFKTTSNLPLIDVLKGMGIEKAFIKGGADLSGIDGTHDLYVTKAIQKAVVEVSETGTVASVASGVVASTRTIAVKEEQFNFVANRPFIYFIRHNPSGIMLFMGRFMNP